MRWVLRRPRERVESRECRRRRWGTFQARGGSCAGSAVSSTASQEGHQRDPPDVSCIKPAVGHERIPQRRQRRRISRCSVGDDHRDRLLPVRQDRLGKVANEDSIGEAGGDGGGCARDRAGGKEFSSAVTLWLSERAWWQELLDCDDDGISHIEHRNRKNEATYSTLLLSLRTCCRPPAVPLVHSKSPTRHQAKDSAPTARTRSRRPSSSRYRRSSK